jgi:hypothetical protein
MAAFCKTFYAGEWASSDCFQKHCLQINIGITVIMTPTTWQGLICGWIGLSDMTAFSSPYPIFVVCTAGIGFLGNKKTATFSEKDPGSQLIVDPKAISCQLG